jgi:excisionase family DNA binding protein
MRDVMTVREAAERLRTHPETIRRWIRAGLLPARLVGRTYIIDAVSLVGFVPPKRTGRPRKS